MVQKLTWCALFVFYLHILVLASGSTQAQALVKYSIAPHIKFQSEPKSIKILKYLSSCALKENQALAHQEEEKEYVFKGRLGLAPEWVHRPFSKKEQAWVSACLMARTNFFGVPVQVLLKGEHPILKNQVFSKINNKNNLLEEGAFYGNLFIQASESKLYVCSGRDIQEGKDIFKKRICALPSKIHQKNKCGFVYMGPCQEVCQKQRGKSGAYVKCRDLEGKYHEAVITTYLEEEASGR